METGNCNAVITFTRYPTLGKVKTRLAAETSKEFALAFYRTCAEHTFNELCLVKKNGCDIYIFGSTESELQQIRNWTKNLFLYFSQDGDDLGVRMFNAFKKIFSNNYKKVIIIGTDAPDINCDVMLEAFTVLNNNDCVIGPATDGGYYLLGFKDKVIDLFSNINWSTELVFMQTMEKIRQYDIKYSLLEKLIDVDTRDDLIGWHSNFIGNNNHPVHIFTQDNKSRF